MNPQILFVVRIVLFAVVAVASSLQAGGDWKDAVVSGVVAAGAYAGVGAGTKVEPQVGRKSS